MTEHAELAPLVEDEGEHAAPPFSRAGDAGARNRPNATAERDKAEPRAATAPTATEATQEPVAANPHSGGRGFVVACSLVALVAACITLAAPTLRPAIAELANTLFGRGNTVSWLVAPATDTTWRTARDEVLQAVNTRMAEYTARIDRLAAAQQATTADVARATANVGAGPPPSEPLARAVDDLTRQTKELRAMTTTLDVRTRAAGLLTLSLRLRRDVDAGLPIERDNAALMASGPYPVAIERALQRLRKYNDGVPTMRDLADTFEPLMARFVAQSDMGSSWAGRSWSRVTALFGAGAPSSDAMLLEHMRALAVDGRFSEAADAIEASSYADLGRDWVAQVRARATAVVAIQSILSYSLTAYEDAYSLQAADAGGKPTQ